MLLLIARSQYCQTCFSREFMARAGKSRAALALGATPSPRVAGQFLTESGCCLGIDWQEWLDSVLGSQPLKAVLTLIPDFYIGERARNSCRPLHSSSALRWALPAKQRFGLVSVFVL